jgi:hypothetical protein
LPNELGYIFITDAARPTWTQFVIQALHPAPLFDQWHHSLWN